MNRGVTSTTPFLWNCAQGWLRSGPQVEVVAMAALVTTPEVFVNPIASAWQVSQALPVVFPLACQPKHPAPRRSPWQLTSTGVQAN